MATPFLGEIMICSFNFAPKGWALCNGQVLPIQQNQALFSLLGTPYGGNGQQTFGLPNLKGRIAMHAGSGHVLGELGGESTHTISSSEVPTHVHSLSASPASANTGTASGNVLASAPIYAAANHLTGMNPASVSTTGGSQAHENEQPYLVVSFCIALQGIFPSQN